MSLPLPAAGPAPSSESLRFALTTRADCLGAAVKVRRLAQAMAWPVVVSEELAILVSELCNNAVRHGGGGNCAVSMSDRSVEIEVTDAGQGFPAHALTGEDAPAAHRRGGLGEGLRSARRLSSSLVLENPPGGGARACATRHLPNPR